MAKVKYVKLPLTELQRLLEKEIEIDALDCGGVDNWDWYSESFKEAAYSARTEDGKKFEDYEEYVNYFISEDYIKANYEVIEEEM